MLGVPGLLVYFQFVGFSAEWRASLAEALGGRAFAVEIGRLTFHPFEGIVAEGVNVRQRAPEGLELARIDRLVVSPNLAALLRGQILIDRLDLENTNVALPFATDGKKPDAIVVRDISASLLSGSGQVTISHADCRFEGIEISVRGHLLLPAGTALQRRNPGGGPLLPVATLRAALAALRRIEFADPQPRLDIEVSGDLSRPETVAAEKVTLRAGRVRAGNLSFDRVLLDGSYVDRQVRITSLRASGPSGQVQAAGSWNFATGGGQLDVSGRLAVAPILELAGRADLASVAAFDRPPALEAALTVTPGAERPSLAVVGEVSVEDARLRGVELRSLRSQFAWRDGRLFLQDVNVRSATGTVRAQVLLAPGDFRLNLDSEADPREFLPFFGPNERKIIALLDFKDMPKLSLRLWGERPKTDAVSGNGHVQLGRTAMRDSWVDAGEADIVIADRAIAYRKLTLRKGSQRATGGFVYDMGRQEVRLEDVRSTLYPADVLMWVDPRIAATVAVYRFRGPPQIRADGLTHMKDPSKNDLRIAVNAPAGLAYQLIGRDLIFGATEGDVRIKGQQVLADVRRAEIYGGHASVRTQVSIAPDDPSFAAQVEVDRVNFPALTKLYFGYAKSEGRMSGRYAFRASLREPTKMKGEGSIRVEDGHVLAIPLFGPLSEVIGAIIPGAGHESARLATADFTIADQLIRTKNLDVQGAGFEIFGEGAVGFPSGKMDLAVRINARGIPGVVFFPVSKLLEYVSTGTVSDPQWRPKIIPREFWSVLGLGGAPEEKSEPPPAPASR